MIFLVNRMALRIWFENG